MRALARGSAESPGAATIINAMATGRGAAFAIDLKVRATVEVNETGTVEGRIVAEHGESTALMELCVAKMFEVIGGRYGAVVQTESSLPIARGLSSSSACCNATIVATSSALQKLGHDAQSDEALVNLGIDASIEAGVTITGAFDDASASYHGGAVVTDNKARRILRRERMPELEAAILVPERKSYSGTADVPTLRLLSPQVEIAHREALEGDLLHAMTMNGLIYCASLGYDPKPTILALRAGAMAASLSGKGPAFVAVGKDANPIADAWSSLGEKIIRTRTNSLGTRVLE